MFLPLTLLLILTPVSSDISPEEEETSETGFEGPTVIFRRFSLLPINDENGERSEDDPAFGLGQVLSNFFDSRNQRHPFDDLFESLRRGAAEDSRALSRQTGLC